MGLNFLFQIIGSLSFDQPWVMTVLFALFYLVLGVIALTRPVAAVVMYFGTSIMNPQWNYPLFLFTPLAKITAGLTLAVCLLNAKKLTFRIPWLFLPLAAFLVMSAVSTFCAIHPELTGRRFGEFNNLGIMMVLTVWAIGERKNYDFLFWGTLASFGFDILKNLVETQTKGTWVTAAGVGGWIADSNDWALALAMSLPLFYTALAMRWDRGWKERLVLGGALTGALLTLTLTSSRGGFLAAAGSGVVFLLMDRKPLKAFLVAGVAAAIVSFYMPQSYIDRVQSIFGLQDQAAAAWNKDIDEDEEEYTGAERVYYWRVASEIMRDNPVTGVGWGNFIKEFARRENPDDNVVAHSTWFQVGAEAGEIALAFYVAMILCAMFVSLSICLKARRTGDVWLYLHGRAIVSGLVAFCIGGTFLSRENSELLFMYIAMAAILPVLAAEEPQKPPTLPATASAPPSLQ